MKIDSSRQSEPVISDESISSKEATSSAASSEESTTNQPVDVMEARQDPSTFEQATQGASNTASSTGESADGSIDGVSLQEIQRREKFFSDYMAESKLAAVGDVDAYKRLVVLQTGQPPTRKQLETFELGGGLPLLGVERQSQLLNDPNTSKAFSDRWNKAWGDYKKGLGGDLEAWKRYNAALSGQTLDFAEEFQFEDGGGPDVLANENQMAVLGTSFPQEHLDRMAKLQDVVEKAISGDAKAQSQVEAAFGMIPGSLSSNLVSNPALGGMLQGITAYRPENQQPGSSETPKQESTTEGWGFHAWATDPGNQPNPGSSSSPPAGAEAGSDPSEWSPFPSASSSSNEQPASDPTEWAPFPGNSSSADGSGAAVGINATDVREDGSVLITLTDGTAHEFTSVGEAMEWEKSALYSSSGNSESTAGAAGAAAAGGASGAAAGASASSESTSTSESSTTTSTTTEEPAEEEEEAAVEENDDEDAYINPDFDSSTPTELTQASKLKLEQGGGITDVRPDLLNDTPADLASGTADRFRFVRDSSPDGDPMSGMSTPNLNNTAGPETRPELQPDAPDAPDDSGINPYAGKG